MNAAEYIQKGLSFDADGWIITLEDQGDDAECPVAVHKDNGRVMLLFYNDDWQDEEPRLDDDMAHYSTDWSSSSLDEHWGNPAKLIDDLRGLYDRHLLRVRDAIHGVPGASELGALLI